MAQSWPWDSQIAVKKKKKIRQIKNQVRTIVLEVKILKLSNYTRWEDSEIININNPTPVGKSEQKRHRLVLPYQGGKGSCLIKFLQKRLKNFLSIGSTS